MLTPKKKKKRKKKEKKKQQQAAANKKEQKCSSHRNQRERARLARDVLSRRAGAPEPEARRREGRCPRAGAEGTPGGRRRRPGRCRRRRQQQQQRRVDRAE